MTSISDNAVTAIILHMRPWLEEIDLSIDEISCAKVLELKAMLKLRILICRHLKNEENDIEIVKSTKISFCAGDFV